MYKDVVEFRIAVAISRQVFEELFETCTAFSLMQHPQSLMLKFIQGLISGRETNESGVRFVS